MAPKKSKTGNIGTFTGSEFKDILSEILEDDPNVNSKNGVVTATINVDGNASKEMEQISEDTKEAARSMKDLGETAEKTGKTISDSFDQASRKVSKDIEDIGKKVQKIYKSFGKNNSLKDIELGFAIDDDSVGKIDKQLKNKVKSVVNNTNRELDAYKNSLKEFADIGTNYKASGRTNDEVKSLYMSSDFTTRLYNADEVKEASKKYIEQLDTSDKRIINYIQNREALYSSLKNLENQVDINTTDFSDTEKNKSMLETMSKMTKIAKMIEHVDGLIKDRNGKYKNENPIDVNNYTGMLNSFYEKMTSPEVLSQKFEKQFQEMQEVVVEFIGYISKVKVSDGVIDASPILEKVNKTADKSKKKVQEVVQEVKKASDYISDTTKLEGKALTNWNNLNKEKGTKSVSKANQYEFVGQIANVLRNGGKLNEDSKAYKYYLQLLEENAELKNFAESIKKYQSSGATSGQSYASGTNVNTEKLEEETEQRRLLNEQLEHTVKLFERLSHLDLGTDVQQQAKELANFFKEINNTYINEHGGSSENYSDYISKMFHGYMANVGDHDNASISETLDLHSITLRSEEGIKNFLNYLFNVEKDVTSWAGRIQYVFEELGVDIKSEFMEVFNNLQTTPTSNDFERDVSSFVVTVSQLENYSKADPEWIKNYTEQIRKGEISLSDALDEYRNKLSQKMQEIAEEEKKARVKGEQVKLFINEFGDTSNFEPDKLSEYSKILKQISDGALTAAEGIESFKKVLNGGSGQDTIDATETVESKVEKIKSAIIEIESITKYNLGSVISHFDKLDAETKEKCISILNSIGLVNENGEFLFGNKAGGNAKAFITDEFVILQKAIDKDVESLAEFISKLQEAKKAGINVAEIYGHQYTSLTYNPDNFPSSIPGYEIQEKANGTELHQTQKGLKSLENSISESQHLLSASKDHLTKFVQDWIALNNLGLQIDPSKSSNFFYDINNGFEFIDLALKNTKSKATDTETMFREIITSLTDTGSVFKYKDANLTNITGELAGRVAEIFKDLGLLSSDQLVSLTEQYYSDWTNVIKSKVGSQGTQTTLTSDTKVEEITEEVKELTQAEKEAAEYAERLGRVLGITNKKALASIRDKIYEYRQNPEADLKTDKDGFLIAGTITDEFEFFAKTGTSFNEVLAEISKHIRTGKNDVDAYAEKWKQVRDYVSKSRLYISQTDKEDLGNDYSRVVSTIGRNHIMTEKMRQDKGLELSQSGYNIIELLSEMNDQLGTTFNLTNSTQDAFIELYEFLRDKPLKVNIDGLPENIKNTVDEILNGTFTSYKWSSPKISGAKFNQSSKSNDATDTFVQNEKKKEKASSDATDTIVNNERKQQEEQQKTADEEKQSAKKKHNYEIIKAVRNKDGSWSDTFQDGIGRTFEEGERVDQEGNLHRYWRELTNYTQLEKEAVKYTNQLALAYADLEKEQRKATPDTYVLQTIVDQIDLLESRLQDVKDQAIAYDGEKDPQYDYALFEKRVSKETDEYALKLQVKTANEIRQENEANLKAIERQNKELEKSNSFLSKQKIELRKIRQDSDSKLEAKKGILNNDRVAEADRKVLQDLYDNINRKINDYETSNHKLSRKEKDTLIEEIAELKLKKLELQNKYYGSTSLSPTELDDNKSILTSNYDLLISRAKEAGTYTKDLVKSLNDQRKAIDNIQDSNGVKVFTDHLKAARAEFVKLKQEAHEKQAKNDKTYEEKYDAIKKYADERDYLNQLLTEEIRLGKSDELTQKIDDQTKKCKSLRLEAEKAKNVISGMLQGGVISKRKANAATGLFENVINGRRRSFGVLRSAQSAEDKKVKQAQDRADAQAKKQKEKADKESNARKYAEDLPYLRSEVEKLLKLLNEDPEFGVFQSIEAGTKGTTITFMKELEDSTKKTIVTVKDLWEVWNSLENGTFKAKNAGDHSTKNIKRTDVEKAYKTLADNEERILALQAKDRKDEKGNNTITREQKEELEKLNVEREKALEIINKKTATTEAEIKAQERWNEVTEKSAELSAKFNSHEEQVKDLLSSSQNSFKDFENKLTKDDGTKADSTINYYRKQIDDLNNDLQTGKVSIEKYNEEFLKISQNMKNTVLGDIGADQARSEMKNLLIQMGAAESEIGTFDEKNQTLTATFRNQNGELEKVTLQYNALAKSIDISKKSVDRIESGLLKFAKGIKGKFEGIGQYVMMYLGFNDIIRYIREGITVVRELDTALTEMKKVSDETTGSLQRFQKASFEIADSIGSTAEQIQNSAADFMRLGKDLETASKLAEHANIYANVGDMGIEEATSHMVSSIQAWKSEFSSEVEASASIIDRYNEIGNNFAITSADIGSAMERSAAALKEGGNTLNEALGLITAGNIIQQNADTTANALKILSLRIRGSKTELEAMGESTDDLASSTSKLREEIKALTGVDIMENEDTYKSTAKIIQEIGKNWEKLSDVSQASALEKLAGEFSCLKFVETHFYRTHLIARIA